MTRRLLAALSFSLVALAAGVAHAACSTPSGNAGDQIYNSTYSVMQYCNGTNWINMGGVSSSVTAAGSSGAVQFNTGNVLAADSSYFVWDSTNHRLGIGSTAPTATLDIVGAVKISSTLAVTGNVTLSGTGNSVGTITSGIWNGTAIDLATYASGALPAASFPALTGDVTTVAGALATTIGAAKVTNAMLAGSIAASKLVGTDIATVGTITSGVWNAGAVTSSGAVTATTVIPSGSTAPTNGMYLPAANKIGFSTNSTVAMVIDSSQNVAIGSTTPSVKLDVVGTILSRVNNAGSSTSIDWSTSNVAYTSANCGAMTFTNMQDGGSYTLVLTGATSGTCSFSQSGLTFKLPTGHGATTASKHTVYSFIRAGSNVYVAWIPGY